MAEYHEQMTIAHIHAQRAIKKYISHHAVELSVSELQGLVGQLEDHERSQGYHAGEAAKVAEAVRLQVEAELEKSKNQTEGETHAQSTEAETR